MKKVLIIMFLMSGYFVHAQEVYFVAPPDHAETPGNDTLGVGSFAAPWATFQKAFNEAQAGDTVYFRGGVYYSIRKNKIEPKAYVPRGNSGTAENPISYFGYPGEWPILDCVRHCDDPEASYNGAIEINHAGFIHFKDIEIRNVVQCDSTVTGAIATSYAANLTFEHIIMHEIAERGYWINGGAWGDHYGEDYVPEFEYDTTRWINCDVYNLCDTLGNSGFPNPGNAADGYKTQHYKGNYVSWEGCRTWNYSDDAWDTSSGDGAIFIWNNCWAMASNKYEEFIPEGNGWKLTSPQYPSAPIPLLTMSNCIAVYCPGQGIYNNLFLDYFVAFPNKGLFYNNIAYACGINIYDKGDFDYGVSVFRNNIAYGATSSAAGSPYDVYIAGDVDESHNTWDWEEGWPGFIPSVEVTVSHDDFVSLDSLAIVSQFTAQRNHDGSLPDFNALRLTIGSDLIDAGTDVGLSYNGISPDIGAFEYGTMSIEITSPSIGSSFTQGDKISIKAEAEDINTDNDIIKVEFYIEDTEIDINLGVGELISTNSWSFSWNNSLVGYHSLRAVATNNQGETATSSRAHVLISPSDSDDSQNIGFLSENLNKGIFTFTLFEPPRSICDITIISLEGKVIYKETMNETKKLINLFNISPGMYILFLSSNKRILSTHKFVKQ